MELLLLFVFNYSVSVFQRNVIGDSFTWQQVINYLFIKVVTSYFK